MSQPSEVDDRYTKLDCCPGPHGQLIERAAALAADRQVAAAGRAPGGIQFAAHRGSALVELTGQAWLTLAQVEQAQGHVSGTPRYMGLIWSRRSARSIRRRCGSKGMSDIGESQRTGAPMTSSARFPASAAFPLVAVVRVELVLMRGELTVASARTLLRMDSVYGLSAVVLLVVGFLRVFPTEKGADYYFHSGPFLVKLALFIVVGLLSILPTVQFLGWRKALKEGRCPALDDGKRRRIRMVIHIELTLLFVIMLCAALMARASASSVDVAEHVVAQLHDQDREAQHRGDRVT